MSPHLPAAAVVLSPARVQQAIYILARPRALSAVFCCPSLLSSLGRKERGNGGSLPRRGSMIFSLPENAGRTYTDHTHQATPCNKHYVFHIMRPASWVLYTYYQHQHHGHILHNVEGFPDSRRHTSVHPSPFIQVDHQGAVAHAGRGTGAGASVRLPPCKPGGGGRNMGRYVTARDITGSSCVSLHRRQPPEISARLLAYMTSPRQSSRACRCSFATPRSRLASFVRCRRRTPWGGGAC